MSEWDDFRDMGVVSGGPPDRHKPFQGNPTPPVSRVVPPTQWTEREQKLSIALWAAIDVVRETVGRFDSWPLALKQAFSEAIIDTSPPSEADIKRTRELAEKYGWNKDTP